METANHAPSLTLSMIHEEQNEGQSHPAPKIIFCNTKFYWPIAYPEEEVHIIAHMAVKKM